MSRFVIIFQRLTCPESCCKMKTHWQQDQFFVTFELLSFKFFLGLLISRYVSHFLLCCGTVSLRDPSQLILKLISKFQNSRREQDHEITR